MFQIVLLAHALFKEAHSLRNKRFRVVSEQSNTEERRGKGFSVCPIFRVVFDSRSLSVPCFFYTVILIKDSKRDSCSGCMPFYMLFYLWIFFPNPFDRPRLNGGLFSLFQYFARMYRSSF